jgi:hypothetical protein
MSIKVESFTIMFCFLSVALWFLANAQKGIVTTTITEHSRNPGSEVVKYGLVYLAMIEFTILLIYGALLLLMFKMIPLYAGA